MTFHLQVQRILDTSSHCTVIDGAGEFHDGVKVKIADLHNLVEAHEAKLAALLEPGEYGDLLYKLRAIDPYNATALAEAAAVIEQLQAQKREVEAKLAECMEATSRKAIDRVRQKEST